MRPVLPLLTALALLAGCSSRERTNPLDPANPVTGGRPAGFNAIAGHAIVTLEWTAQPALAIDGFRIERLAPGDSLWRPVGDVQPASTSRALDSSVSDGLRYAYRLYYVIRGQLGHLPAEDHATPGAVIPYVADAGASELDRLSPDGRDVAARFHDAGNVQSLAVDRSNGRVWTSAPYDGLVTARMPGELRPVEISGLHQPFTLAVSGLDESAWICELGGSLAHFTPAGAPATPGVLDLLDGPTGVAVGPADYSVWACENSGNRLRHWSALGVPLAGIPVDSPSRVAVDSLTRGVWVTSLARGRIWRFTENGARIDSSSAAAGPIGICVDRRHGRVWVADAAANRVLALDPVTGALLFTVNGLREARDVDVEPVSGDAWVVARADGEVVRLSKDGVVLERCGGFVDPVEVRLDPGTQ